MIPADVAEAIRYELDELAIAIAQPDADLIDLEFKLQEIEAAYATALRGGRVWIKQSEQDDD